LDRPLKFLDWGFTGMVVAVLLFVAAAFVFGGPSELPPTVESLSVIGVVGLLYAAGWLFAASLAVLAHRTGRSWIVWLGLTWLTAPIGPVVAYMSMRGHARMEQLSRRAHAVRGG
jgi:hypothetical protein